MSRVHDILWNYNCVRLARAVVTAACVLATEVGARTGKQWELAIRLELT